MTDARPLRAVFDELAGGPASAGPADPAEVLAGSGHADLPGELVTEAIVSYAGTAPVEVAAHLAPFVMAHSPVPRDWAGDWAGAGAGAGAGEILDPAAGLDLLVTAPAGWLDDQPIDAGEAPAAGGDGGPAAAGLDPDFGAGDTSGAGPLDPTDPPGTDPFALDFAGAGPDFAAGYPEPEPGLTGPDLVGEFAPPADPRLAEPEEPPAEPDAGLTG
jgi:hypothetical protein